MNEDDAVYVFVLFLFFLLLLFLFCSRCDSSFGLMMWCVFEPFTRRTGSEKAKVMCGIK
jgi:hypothetical protein